MPRTTRSNSLEAPPLAEVIDNIGLGWAQFKNCSTGGAIWLADGAELLLITTVTNAVSNDWDLSPIEKGSVVTVVFIGVLFGNLCSGPLGDSKGRRFPVLISYFCIVVFSLLSSWTQDVEHLMLCRLMVGFSFGIGQPAYNAYQSEISPSKLRILVMGMVANFFTLGEVYTACLIMWNDPTMEDLDWRVLLQAGAFPAAFFGVLSFFVFQESPAWLANQGRYDEALEVLGKLASDNGYEGMDVHFQIADVDPQTQEQTGLREQLGIVFGSKMGPSTAIVCYSCFVLNFIFYGGLYAFPQVIAEVDFGGSPGANLLAGALWEFVGNAIGTMCAFYLLRKTAMKLFLVTCMCSLLCFTAGAANKNETTMKYVTLYAGYFGIKIFQCIGWLVVYMYATEIYPTKARATGTAVAMAGGRLAAMGSPLIFEYSQEQTGGFAFFFHLTAALCAVNILLVDLLPFETAGKSLKDDISSSEDEEVGHRLKEDISAEKSAIINKDSYGATN